MSNVSKNFLNTPSSLDSPWSKSIAFVVAVAGCKVHERQGLALSDVGWRLVWEPLRRMRQKALIKFV